MPCRCPGCGAAVEGDQPEPPEVGDFDAWSRLAMEHGTDCPWVIEQAQTADKNFSVLTEDAKRAARQGTKTRWREERDAGHPRPSGEVAEQFG